MKTINCREAGFDCDYTVRGETEEEVMKNGIEHAKNAHNMKEEDITPEIQPENKRPYLQFLIIFLKYCNIHKINHTRCILIGYSRF